MIESEDSKEHLSVSAYKAYKKDYRHFLINIGLWHKLFIWRHSAGLSLRKDLEFKNTLAVIMSIPF